ncbi:MAG: hypothetical protein LKJ90_08640 [Faecalibacterium sp.]|jgi:hypothetical protein|nr:hypothetical protein [Faecalibacterium sp.]
MTKAQIALGIVLFAGVTILLYLWGMRKTLTQGRDISRMLTGKCANKVLKYLKTHDTVSTGEIEKLIGGVTAGEAWSRRRAKVQDTKTFTTALVRWMLEQHYLESAPAGRYRVYSGKK